ncbi:TRAP transporter substrate-binding protein [Ancylobacter sp. A5.8]|uniref:TRAP transporter substrate-binding protein n=1 Tax=Ancylobacter gelatini TaxID=2919920 RepID=UPI001F4E49D1|nr:TRAP transporter substrate-binding protein [Ancylobacter gelatini]MCJ8143356.1 TRAP transporter substrate-binding protein [Ancylobacter gelatini]
MAAGLVFRMVMDGAGRGLLARMFVIITVLAAGAGAGQARHEPTDTVKLSIVGGLAAVTQFTQFERPFWEREITERSGGRITATIRPFDGGGLRGQEMLQLMRLGVVPFGTVLLSLISGDEPELNAPDLPVLNPDMATLRVTVGAFRARLKEILLQRYGIELLGVYTYPAQVLYCKDSFAGLDDLAGRRVRTSSVSQSELMAALGAVPVIVPFAEIVRALESDVADCAITGTLSGFEIGLPGVTTHVHAMALSWGLSFFGVNLASWNALAPELQRIIREGVDDLEARIWLQAEADTERGLACNTGEGSCSGPAPGHMKLVTSAADEARRSRLIREVVLPRWIERCGESCKTAWNRYLAPAHGIILGGE